MTLKHKFGAKPTVLNGIKYHSKLEARYSERLEFLKKSGDILFYLRQVPFDLPGKIKFRLDFMEFWQNGDVILTECKGYMTSDARIKLAQVIDLYNVKINIVKK